MGRCLAKQTVAIFSFVCVVFYLNKFALVVVWKGIHSRSDTNRTGAEGLSFYYPRLLYCLNQMLTVMLLSQPCILSSKIVRPRAPCGARCMGQAVRTWSGFVQGRHTRNSIKERDPIYSWTNGIAQHQSAGG